MNGHQTKGTFCFALQWLATWFWKTLLTTDRDQWMMRTDSHNFKTLIHLFFKCVVITCTIIREDEREVSLKSRVQNRTTGLNGWSTRVLKKKLPWIKCVPGHGRADHLRHRPHRIHVGYTGGHDQNHEPKPLFITTPGVGDTFLFHCIKRV